MINAILIQAVFGFGLMFLLVKILPFLWRFQVCGILSIPLFYVCNYIPSFYDEYVLLAAVILVPIWWTWKSTERRKKKACFAEKASAD